MTHVAEAAAEETGVDAEIIDLRSLLPLDVDAIQASVEKTGRCLIVHEATLTSGFGAELAAQVTERCFYALEAPVERVAGWDTPYPVSEEWDDPPGPARVGRAPVKAMETEMGVRSIKMPDVGEGVAEAEIVEWAVKVGDLVKEDQVVAAVMTDKATVEIPTPVAGSVLALGGAVGDVLAVGSELIRIDAPGMPDSLAPAAPKSRLAPKDAAPTPNVRPESVAPAPEPRAEAAPSTPPEHDVPAPCTGRRRRLRRRVRRARSRSRRPRCA